MFAGGRDEGLCFFCFWWLTFRSLFFGFLGLVKVECILSVSHNTVFIYKYLFSAKDES